jgi:DNA-binding transcriptional LysR family regulator
MPNSFGRVTVAPALPIFLERYPEVVLELQFSDSPIGFIEEGIDLAVRTGELSDSRLVKRLLTQGSQVTVAAPSYLAKHGTPKKPQDLHDHNCVISRFGPEWTFKEKNGKDLSVRVAGNLTVLNGDVMREAVVAGAGIAQATWWLFRKDLEAGRVVEILPDYAKRGSPVSVLYPANRHLPAKVRVFIDFLVEITKKG